MVLSSYFHVILPGPSRAATHGCLKLDALTMDKQLDCSRRRRRR